MADIVFPSPHAPQTGHPITTTTTPIFTVEEKDESPSGPTAVAIATTTTFDVSHTTVEAGDLFRPAQHTSAANTLLANKSLLGLATTLLVLYSIGSALGLMAMLWRGVLDWRGNVSAFLFYVTITRPLAQNSIIFCGALRV